MTSEEEQFEQRKANLEALKALGVEAYPHKFERRHTISELVAAHGEQSHDELEADSPRDDHQRTDSRDPIVWQGELPGRVGRSREDSDLHPAGFVAAARLRHLQAARFRRLDWRRRTAVSHAHERADDLGVAPAFPGEVSAAAAGKVAWADGCRDSLPPALPGSHR